MPSLYIYSIAPTLLFFLPGEFETLPVMSLVNVSSPVWVVSLAVVVIASIFLLVKLWRWSLHRAMEKKLLVLRKGQASLFFSEHSDPTERQEDLRQVLDKYNEFADMLPEVVFECDVDGKLLFINKSATEILGFEKKDLEKGVNIFDFLHPDDIARARDNLALVAQNGDIGGKEYRVFTKNRSVIYGLAYAVPVFKAGILAGFRGLLVDISERKKNEDIILILQDIVSYMDLGLSVFKLEDPLQPQSFALEMVNPEASKLLGFLNSANVGKCAEELSPLFRRIELANLLFEVFESQKTKEIDDFLYQPDPSRTRTIFNLKIFPLPQDRVAILWEDITLRKSTEGMLRMTNFGIENAGDIILWLDENASFTYVNQTACNRYGYSAREMLSMNVTHVDSRVTMMQWFELTQILEGKPSLTMESINVARDGETFPVEISISRFVYEDKKQYFAIVKDISERKRNDELEQKIQVARKSADLKQQFLANMSHEIRTPMTGIMGMTSLLMRTNLTPPQQEYVRNIKISSENLLNIINDVLDLSKIEAGKLELKPVRINFEEFVVQTKEFFVHQAQRKALQFATQIDPLIPQYIIADETRLKQLVNNLLSNAFKFTDEGSVSVSFFLVEKKHKTLLLECQVKDTGTGISEKNQLQIFEKFTQIDTSLTRPFEGTGLGLAICRELSHMMGGEIHVESELGKGSTFRFTFQASYDETDEKTDEENLPLELQHMNLSVLHVEDKVLNQKVVGFILLNAGCNVDFARNGQEAIEFYQPGKYDVILMDIQMPVMDGISAYKELKRLHGDKLCPVIGLSANALEGDAEKFMEFGLDDYISKPFKTHVLYEKLMKWASGKNKQADGRKTNSSS